MALSHKAAESFPEELELFDAPTVQTAIESSFNSLVSPSSTNLDTDVLEFEFASSDHFIDPS